MRISGCWLRRHISGTLLLAMLTPFMAEGALAQQATSSGPKAESTSSAQTPSTGPQNANEQSANMKLDATAFQTEALPDSPGSVRLQTIAENRAASGQESQPAPSPQQPRSQQAQQPQQPQLQQPQQQINPQEPVGTAAAGSVKATGVAASQPAGAAIAPAKQRRTRSILIKVGALVGAGIAVGTVVGLSAASPSHPR